MRIAACRSPSSMSSMRPCAHTHKTHRGGRVVAQPAVVAPAAETRAHTVGCRRDAPDDRADRHLQSVSPHHAILSSNLPRRLSVSCLVALTRCALRPSCSLCARLCAGCASLSLSLSLSVSLCVSLSFSHSDGVLVLPGFIAPELCDTWQGRCAALVRCSPVAADPARVAGAQPARALRGTGSGSTSRRIGTTPRHGPASTSTLAGSRLTGGYPAWSSAITRR